MKTMSTGFHDHAQSIAIVMGGLIVITSIVSYTVVVLRGMS